MYRAPVGIGKVHYSGEDMYMSGMRGKCLDMIHVYQDTLWALGDKSIKMPIIPTPVTNETPVDDDDKSDEDEKNEFEVQGDENLETKQFSELKLEDCETLKEAEKEETNEDADEKEEDEIDHEKLLVDSFCCAAKFKSKEFKLPVIVSTFMKVMQSCW